MLQKLQGISRHFGKFLGILLPETVAENKRRTYIEHEIRKNKWNSSFTKKVSKLKFKPNSDKSFSRLCLLDKESLKIMGLMPSYEWKTTHSERTTNSSDA